MSEIIYIKENDNGEITLSKDEFERVMKEKYNAGFKYGAEMACKIMEIFKTKESFPKIPNIAVGVPPIYQFLDKQ